MFTESAYRRFLEKQPQLAASGLAGSETSGFAKERQRLEGSFAEFALCCDWLLDCTPMRRVSCVAPWSGELRSVIERQTGTAIPVGALIAAVLFLRLPHYHPDGSTEVRVGISVRSPALCAEPMVQP
jgi:hypothetical protein